MDPQIPMMLPDYLVDAADMDSHPFTPGVNREDTPSIRSAEIIQADEHDLFNDQASRLAELGSLAAMIAHEINNQMTRAQGWAQLALREQHGPRTPDAPYQTLEHLLTIIKRTAVLTESMMRYAEPESVASDTPATLVGDIQHAHDTAEGFAASPATNEPTHYSLSCNTQNMSPRIDPVALEQVLINLYINAQRAIDDRRADEPGCPASILVNATLECSTWNTPTIRITVQDTGTGISEHALRSIFRPWDQGDPKNSATNSGAAHTRNGHGLGLAVCEKLITNAGGSIRCSSTPGIGTTFTIVLPAIEATNAENDVISTRAA